MPGTIPMMAILLIAYKVVMYWIKLQQQDLKQHQKKLRESFMDEDELQDN